MEFRVPELGEGVHEGELTKWRVKKGDKVIDDQPLCDVMTDKATVEIPSPFTGTVKELHVAEGAAIKVGQLIVSFEGAVGAKPTQAPSHTTATQAPAPAAISAAPKMPQSNAQVLAAPSTRRMAREMGVDLAQVSGSGPHGRILKEDLRNGGGTHIQTPSRAPQMQGGETRTTFKGLRKKIAEKMRQSKDKAAHFTYVEEADATELVKLRNQAKEIGAKQGIKVTYLPFIMKAMVAALRQHPSLNSSLDEEKGEIVTKHYYNIGLSVQTDDGLSAPVVKGVEHKTVFELAKEIQTLVDKARMKKLTLEDLQGGTITLTNAGSIGGLFATPVINYPEVAILGFNKIFRKPVALTEGGVERIAIRDWTYFSISLDHRIVDGAVGAEFMNTFIKYIETPSLLLLESF